MWMRIVTIQFNEDDPIEIGKTSSNVTWGLSEPGDAIKFTNEHTGETFTIKMEEDGTGSSNNNK